MPIFCRNRSQTVSGRRGLNFLAVHRQNVDQIACLFFFHVHVDTNGFRRMKEGGQIYKTLPQMWGAALSERKVAGSIPTIGDFHTVGPCKKAVFACLATDVK